MDILATQTYYITDRSIHWNEQLYVESEYRLQLSEEVIRTNSHIFSFKDVWDMSYKPMSDNKGILYLHTIQGVFSFYIKTRPFEFIEIYQEIKLAQKRENNSG
ncbi:hypothetical protein ACFFIX_02030 [Metabacillus herbersteinensis]|uniref:YokE-like PH domain-containing protein n=1 Tax=Metabacillus herbersteinensis TaxID=283816 RepID=A0ABV6G9U0_9BACI